MNASLLGLDWREAWRAHNRARKAPDGVECWNERAEDFSHHAGTSSYTDAFIDYLALGPAQRILDVGCGSGTLAIPLARAGHEVFAVDFSPGMLDTLGCRSRAEGLTGIRAALLDFNTPWEEWEAVGVTEDCVDIALASRSTMVEDLGEAFEKLERAARERVVVTMATEFGPRGIKRMGETHEGDPCFVPDFIFAINLLFQNGRYPELRFIDSYKNDTPGAPRLIRWAFISWCPVP